MIERKRQRLTNELAEIAATSLSLEDYRREALDKLQTHVGFDLAVVHSTYAGVTGYGFDAADSELTAEQSACVLHFTPAELQRMSSGMTVNREEVFSRTRMDALRDTPFFFAGYAALANWAKLTRVGVVGLIAVRQHGKAYSRAELDIFDAATPILTLAEMLHAGQAPKSIFAWASDTGLTRRQADVVHLVARGLRNREIARVLCCSELTVRNHLAVAFRKAGVQTRQELVFQAMTHEQASHVLPGFAYAERAIMSAVVKRT